MTTIREVKKWELELCEPWTDKPTGLSGSNEHEWGDDDTVIYEGLERKILSVLEGF